MKFKEIIQSKNDEIYSLHNSIAEMRSEYQTLSGELDLQKVKILFEVKNVKAQCEIDILQLKNEISILKRNIQALEIKYHSSLNEIKTKDRFIKEFIIEKSNHLQEPKEFIYEFFAYYEEMMEKLMNEKESGAIEKEVNNSSIQV
jgi:hypothetical protein